MLALKPELKSRAEGAAKNFLDAASSALISGVFPVMTRQPVDPNKRVRGASCTLRKKRSLRDRSEANDR